MHVVDVGDWRDFPYLGLFFHGGFIIFVIVLFCSRRVLKFL